MDGESRPAGHVDGTKTGAAGMASMDYEDRAAELAKRTVLTPRQAHVAALKERGLTHQQIGDELGIEKSTVDTLSSRINKQFKEAHATVDEIPEEIIDDDVLAEIFDE